MLAVDDLSATWNMGTLAPCCRPATALVEVAVWVGRHLAAVIDALPEGGAGNMAPTVDRPTERPCPVSCSELLDGLDALEEGANPDDYEVMISHTASRGLAVDVDEALRQRLERWVERHAMQYLSYVGATDSDSKHRCPHPTVGAAIQKLLERAAEVEYDSDRERLPYTDVAQVER